MCVECCRQMLSIHARLASMVSSSEISSFTGTGLWPGLVNHPKGRLRWPITLLAWLLSQNDANLKNTVITTMVTMHRQSVHASLYMRMYNNNNNNMYM